MLEADQNDSGRSGAPVVGFGGLLPERLLRFRRPLWYQELLLIAVSYWLYGQVRNAIPNKLAIAQKHARGVQHLQDVLHLNFELSINQFVAAHEPIAQVMDYYYATLHFIVTIGVLVWLFVKRPALYRGARTVLFATSGVALAGFYLFPLAPPRLMPQYGYIDTLLKFHTWGSLADPKIAQHSNQFAAMPSLHIGWSLWCGLTIAACATRTWVRVLALSYPVATLIVIVSTANHYFLDAVGGVIVLAAGYGIQYLLSGHGAYESPVGSPALMPDEQRVNAS
ncbi:PAP2 superfamily protein [Frankineae bacterium MT45]|nr:PAP2 superfamily protein [Frankineae bacterium MT45]